MIEYGNYKNITLQPPCQVLVKNDKIYFVKKISDTEDMLLVSVSVFFSEEFLHNRENSFYEDSDILSVKSQVNGRPAPCRNVRVCACFWY